MISSPLVLQVFRRPAQAATLGLAEWDLLLRQAVSANLTASLFGLLEDHGLLGRIPAAAREHLEWANILGRRHSQAVRWEVRQIVRALAETGVPIVLLKGAAYAIAGLPPGRGRLFSDIDILVPKDRLGDVEAALMMHGWAAAHHDEYDQRYYREWMHELPPMQHIRRDTLIDVHHAILPETAAARPDPGKLRAAARPVDGHEGVKVLAPADMVLHSAVHLLYDGELEHGMRDMLDIHRLLVDFGRDASFWHTLPVRARELELDRPLFYALRYASRLLGTAVPAHATAAADAGRPNRVLLALMDQLFGRALLPPHPSCSDWATPAARFLLYIRANWLRMPPFMLARHLFHKAFISPKAIAGA